MELNTKVNTNNGLYRQFMLTINLVCLFIF